MLGTVIVPSSCFTGICVSMPGGLIVAVTVIVGSVVAVAMSVILIAAKQREKQGEDEAIHEGSSRFWGGRP